MRKLLKKFAKILGKNNYLVIGVDIRKNKKLWKSLNDLRALQQNLIKYS